MQSLTRSFLSIGDLSKEEIIRFLDMAALFKEASPGPILKGKIMASCFFEPSTRTRLSFEAAMKSLGGDVIGFSESATTSASKGESLYDTMKIVGGYSDVIILRHPKEGAAQLASEATTTPIINAGDGSNEHPSQTLLDLFTIRETQGRLEGLKIAWVGDLLYGRTVHSLARAAALFDMRMYFIAPEGLDIPTELKRELKSKSALFSFHRDVKEVVDEFDILYVTRMQKERHRSQSEGKYIITPEVLKGAKETAKVLHPLPRVDEIDRS